MAPRRIDGMPVSEFGFARTPLRRRLVDLILNGEKTAGAGLVRIRWILTAGGIIALHVGEVA